MPPPFNAAAACSEYESELREKLVPTLLAGYKLWIPAHIVNFALVPNRQVGGWVGGGGWVLAGLAAAPAHALLQGGCQLGTAGC